MTTNPLTICTYPHAILHIDGDGFFASIEQAMDPSLKGKPVVTGRERGIASAMSIEAKRAGVKRGMRISEIREVCPDAVIVPSDYETYSLFSKRMFEIVRRYTPDIEEYSIDECFAEITGLRAPLSMSYQEMATRIKEELETELGVTFSVGLAPTKVLAKVASGWDKPSGFTFIPGKDAHRYLKYVQLDDLWGIGTNTALYLARLEVTSALEFAHSRQEWVEEYTAKPYLEIWHELRGECVYPVETGEREAYKSISKTKTFTPPSASRELVFAQLAKNVENAAIKLRRHTLSATRVAFFLKTQDFHKRGLELEFSIATQTPNDMLMVIERYFDQVFQEGVQYRATGVITSGLVADDARQPDLFGTANRQETLREVYKKVDEVDRKFGKHTVFLGSSMPAFEHPNERNHDHLNTQADGERRRPAPGHHSRQRLGVPYLGEVT